MGSQSRIILALASLALLFLYILPMWKITLDAPQYPEGLGMYIWIDTITGEKKHDLQNINGLNHYIGMKRIEPESIPELDFMPWFIGFLVGFGLIGALSGKRWLLYSWVGIFMVGAVVGLVDFYLWEYDYGHNLDAETAIIKIPGMNYQPPLIGSKKLLNFTASSWPASGGWIAFASLGAGLFAALKERRRKRAETAKPRATRMAATIAACSIGLGAIGCAPSPRSIDFGFDQCEHCRMTILDQRFGAELVNRNGKVYTFDSVECLAAHVNERSGEQAAVHSLWVVDFARPGNLVPLPEAVLARGPNFLSPMGMNLAAFGPIVSGEQVEHAFGGKTVEWRQILELMNSHQESVHPASLGL